MPAGNLNTCLPARTQERLGQASALGFFAVYFGLARAAFLTLPNARDVAAQWACVAEWM